MTLVPETIYTVAVFCWFLTKLKRHSLKVRPSYQALVTSGIGMLVIVLGLSWTKAAYWEYFGHFPYGSPPFFDAPIAGPLIGTGTYLLLRPSWRPENTGHPALYPLWLAVACLSGYVAMGDHPIPGGIILILLVLDLGLRLKTPRIDPFHFFPAGGVFLVASLALTPSFPGEESTMMTLLACVNGLTVFGIVTFFALKAGVRDLWSAGLFFLGPLFLSSGPFGHWQSLLVYQSIPAWIFSAMWLIFSAHTLVQVFRRKLQSGGHRSDWIHAFALGQGYLLLTLTAEIVSHV